MTAFRAKHGRGPGTSRSLPNSPFARAVPEPAPEAYEVGDMVNHDRYGLGSVVGVEDESLIVDFRSETRRIAFPTRKLSRL